MFDTKEYIDIFANIMSEGFIVIDKNAVIQVYNDKAKEIFGLDVKNQKSHKMGSIKDNDIVILATNSLGRDDGDLAAEDLEILGIENENIEVGDALVSISYFNAEKDASFKYLKANDPKNLLVLDKVIGPLEVSVSIDFINKNISVFINDEEYRMDYITSIGFIVILDGDTKELKFYQSQGYTARNESIKDILKGKEYMGKGEYAKTIDIIGKNIFDIHKDDSTFKKALRVAKGENIEFIDEFNEINGFPTISTINPVEKHGTRVGAAIKVEDITELKEIMKERDKALSELNRVEIELENENILKKMFPEIIGDSDKMNYIKRMALKASKSNSTVLLLGESGTGKSKLAKAIHDNSRLKDRPFIHVNCDMLDDEVLEIELFGIEDEGKIKKGYLELADGGSLFLDEIGNLSQSIQVKLLQVLQNKTFYRKGGISPIDVDIRLIAASNKNLEDEIETGAFREDLYYRINVFPIFITPLRDRMSDIYSLLEYLIPKISENVGVRSKNISSEAINNILNYNWPGNVRELENILERAINLCEGDIILSKHIVLDQREEYVNITSLKKTLEYWEKRSIKNALDFFNGDKKMAMKALKISKSTMYEKLSKYKI